MPDRPTDKPSTPPPSPYYLAALDVARILADLKQKDGEK